MLPTSANVTVKIVSTVPANTQAVVVFLATGAKLSAKLRGWLSQEHWRVANELVESKVVTGKSKEIAFHLAGKSQRVYVVGLGDAKAVDGESMRVAGGQVARAMRKHRISRATIVFGDTSLSGDRKGQESAAAEFVTGAMLAAFHYTEYRGTAARSSDSAETTLELSILTATSEAASVDRAVTIAQSQNYARTIATRPGNNINPPELARVAQQLAKETGLKCTVMDEKQLQKLGMGGILAVGAGSNRTPPRLIVLEHAPAGATAKQPVMLVGKAVTFDTGGISIKPADRMGKMVFDKCGAMAVLGTMCAVARLKLPVRVVGLLSSAENHISETAYRPGDILRMFNGVTVEVTNTDAEGRLVLADALAWGIKTYKPSHVIDLATLTGGCVVALGQTFAAGFCDDDQLFDSLHQAAHSSGERVWRMPLHDDYRDMLKSEFADIVNSAGRWGSPCTGAAFLSHFVPSNGSVPWCHLDIAGVADTDKELPYYGKGATGWGVRTLLNWLSNHAPKRAGLSPKRPKR